MSNYLTKLSTYDPGPDQDIFAKKSIQGRVLDDEKRMVGNAKKALPTVAGGLAGAGAIYGLGKKYGGGGKITNTLAALGGAYVGKKIHDRRKASQNVGT